MVVPLHVTVSSVQAGLVSLVSIGSPKAFVRAVQACSGWKSLGRGRSHPGLPDHYIGCRAATPKRYSRARPLAAIRGLRSNAHQGFVRGFVRMSLGIAGNSIGVVICDPPTHEPSTQVPHDLILEARR